MFSFTKIVLQLLLLVVSFQKIFVPISLFTVHVLFLTFMEHKTIGTNVSWNNRMLHYKNVKRFGYVLSIVRYIKQEFIF